MADDSLAVILDRLQALVDMPLGRVHVGRDGPAPPPGASTVPASRFNVLVRGRKRVGLPLIGGAETVELATGDAHFSPANTWERHSWRTPHELLCIVPRADYLRVSLHQVTDALEHQTLYHHTNRRPAPAFVYVLRALETLAREPGRELPRGLLTTYVELAQEMLLDATAIPGMDAAAQRSADIRRYIENSFHEGLTREDVARHFGLSVSHVAQLFRDRYGLGLGRFIADCRMQMAEELLRDTAMSVQQVARQSGWGTTVHFVRSFRERHGLPPARWRRSTSA